MDAVGVEDLDRHRVDPGLEAVGGDVDGKAGTCRRGVVGGQRGVGAAYSVDAWEVELAIHPGYRSLAGSVPGRVEGPAFQAHRRALGPSRPGDAFHRVERRPVAAD